MPTERDLKKRIEIFAWDADGAPAVNRLVDWLCRFPSLGGSYLR
jgi:hypothetical protein